MSKSRSSDEKEKEKEKEKDKEKELDSETEKEKEVEKPGDMENEREAEKDRVKNGNAQKSGEEDDTEDNATGENVQLPLNQLQLATEAESNLKSPVFDSNSPMVRNEQAIPSSPPPSYEHVIEQVRIWVIVAKQFPSSLIGSTKVTIFRAIKPFNRFSGTVKFKDFEMALNTA